MPRPSFRLTAAVTALTLLGTPLPAWSAGDPLSKLKIVRDAETEALLADYVKPIFKVAGISSQDIKLVLVDSREFNAFVPDGNHIFMNTGVIVEAPTPNEIIGVLAHESGHIAGAHQVRMREALARARTLAALSAVLGVAGAVGGGSTRSPGAAGGGIAAISGGSTLAQNIFLSYVRSEEMAADQAAVRYLEKTGQSPRGMLATFRRFADRQLMPIRGTDPYAYTHPLPRDRVDTLAAIVEKSPTRDAQDAPALVARHALVRAKLTAFTESPQIVAGRYPSSDTSLAARYARAVVAYRRSPPAEAVQAVDDLLRERPDYPYFHELKGQILLESGHPREALGPLRRAVELAPNATPIRVMLGHAMVATEDRTLLDEAIRQLSRAAQRDRLDASPYPHLARAHALKGEPAKADLMHAEELFIAGQILEARRFANRARDNLKTGSPDWLRADDIVSYKPDEK